MQEDALIGRQLANYSIERVIGRGGMAVVYFGRDIRLNRSAAIKVIDARFRDSPNYTGRFLQEAKMVAAWRHEHILQIYYADDVAFADLGKLFFFAMEFIDGQNLAEVLAQTVAQRGSVPPEDVLRYGRAIAAALDYAHARGVIHRDVKPANVLVSQDGRVVLSDFGLALEIEQGSIGEVFGSAHYIAPEQARRSSDAVAQSDLYSLGVILYEMLTGVVPFDDPSPTSVALQHITLPPPRPRDINPDLSAEVEEVLLKALSKNPGERYTSGEELMAALGDALVRMNPSVPTRKQIPLAAAPTFPFPPITRPVYRSPVLIAAAVAVIGMFVIAFAAALWMWQGVVTAGRSTALAAMAATETTPPAGQSSPTRATVLAQATGLPASTPTATSEQPAPPATPIPATDTPTTATLSPDATEPPAAPQPTVTWTPRFADGRRMILSWNESSFYMLQVTGFGEVISPVVFERLNADGTPANRFSGKLWAEYRASTLRDWCMRLEIGGPTPPAEQTPYQRPALCEEHYLSSRWPPSGDPSIFWRAQDGGPQFRVLWGREEIQRCDIAAGTCEVYLP